MATTRRVFLEVFGAGAVASAMEVGCGSVITGGPPVNPREDAGAFDGQPGEPSDGQSGAPALQPGDVLAGNVSDLPEGALKAVAGQPVAIGRDANGVYALTLICTHQGCIVGPFVIGTRTGLVCPCHGSQYDRNGAVVRGPAMLPLGHFAVDIDSAGDIVVHTVERVAATDRVPA